MKLYYALIFFMFLCAASSAEAGLPFSSKTISWDEEVLLAEGQKISVQRTVKYGLLVDDTHLFGERGGGPAEKQTIRFYYNGRFIKWEYSHPSWHYSMPDILDFVKGMPVLVLPVYYWGPCDKYNFPREGLVAFGYQNSRWERIAIAELPETLKVNLLRSTHDLRYGYGNKYKNELITTSLKQKLEKNSWGPGQGRSISEVSKFYADVEESCTRIHPPPNPALETTKQNNAAAEVHAGTLVATLKSSSNLPEKISSEDYRKAKGKWTGNGYLANSCEGIVNGIKPVRQYRDGGGWSLVGCMIVLQNEKQIPLSSAQLVTCDNDSIYAIKLQNKDQLIVHRFFHNGKLKDVLHIKIADIDKYCVEGKWPWLWEVLPEKDQLTIVLARYSYTLTADLGGIIEQRLTYSARLPK